MAESPSDHEDLCTLRNAHTLDVQRIESTVREVQAAVASLDRQHEDDRRRIAMLESGALEQRSLIVELRAEIKALDVVVGAMQDTLTGLGRGLREANNMITSMSRLLTQHTIEDSAAMQRNTRLQLMIIVMLAAIFAAGDGSAVKLIQMAAGVLGG